MAVRQTIWAAGDFERRQLISYEVQQLKRMSESLRTRAMRAFMARLSTARHESKRAGKQVKSRSLAA